MDEAEGIAMSSVDAAEPAGPAHDAFLVALDREAEAAGVR